MLRLWEGVGFGYRPSGTGTPTLWIGHSSPAGAALRHARATAPPPAVAGPSGPLQPSRPPSCPPPQAGVRWPSAGPETVLTKPFRHRPAPGTVDRLRRTDVRAPAAC